ncbi:PBP1A family penicillin-binding protein [Virgibacillus ainsalahensis]
MAENSQTRLARRNRKKNKKKPILKKIFIWFLLLCLITGVGALATATYWIATAPELDESKLETPFASEILDQNGEPVAQLGANREKAEYEELPQVLVNAILATEDARFFEHPGVDIIRVGGAVMANLTGGFGSEGASTITMQVIENSMLSSEKKLSIKVQEMWLALQLEQQYSKEEILEMYVNKIYFGNGAYGVSKAAETYFGKTDLSELTLPEAAILAGLPQRPSGYNPFENPEGATNRMQTVLYSMVQQDKISQEQADEAGQVDVTSLLTDEQSEDLTPYEGFLQQVDQEVSEKLDGADIYTDGLSVHTTLNTDIQEYVEGLLTDGEGNSIPYYDEEMQVGMVVLDTQTGAVQAIGPSRNNQGINGFNYATQIQRQPGSTMKPITAYGPAIEYNHMSTSQLINDDEPYPIAGTDQEIRNFTREYQGWVSAREALSESLNVPAAKTLVETGYGSAQTFAEGLGFNFGENGMVLTDAIGGTSVGVSPLQMAGAYSAFGNGGTYTEPYTVTSVEFPNGEVVELTQESKEAMSDYTAYMITDMLQTAITEGTGINANIPGLPVAGKTGTTNRPDVDGAVDSWFNGYTTNYTISIWTGYSDNNQGIENTQIPHSLFRNTMTEISRGMETAYFEQPGSVVEIGNELFVRGTGPSESMEEGWGEPAEQPENEGNLEENGDDGSENEETGEIAPGDDSEESGETPEEPPEEDTDNAGESEANESEDVDESEGGLEEDEAPEEAPEEDEGGTGTGEEAPEEGPDGNGDGDESSDENEVPGGAEDDTGSSEEGEAPGGNGESTEDNAENSGEQGEESENNGNENEDGED